MKLDMIIDPAILLFLSIVFAVLGILCFRVKLKIAVSGYLKNSLGILIVIDFGRREIFFLLVP